MVDKKKIGNTLPQNINTISGSSGGKLEIPGVTVVQNDFSAVLD